MLSSYGPYAARLLATANLLPPGAPLQTPVVQFYAPRRPVIVITLKQVIANPSALRRTESHVHWASSYGFEPDGTFTLNTADDVTFRIDPATGKALNRRYF